MKKMISIRIDENLYNNIKRISKELNISKTQFIEDELKLSIFVYELKNKEQLKNDKRRNYKKA